MPAGRRNVKSSSFKHHAYSDDRHGCDLPTQPKVLPPKHIPLPALPPASDLYFEVDAMVSCILVMIGQYINLHRSVFWLPYSHTDHALNYYLIDYHVLAINFIMLGRRLPVCFLKQACSLCLPASYQPTCTLFIYIVISVAVIKILLVCFYKVAMKHGILSIIFLIYPFVIYVVMLGASVAKFLELRSHIPERNTGARSKHSASIKNSSTVSHVCSMSAETIREEVEALRNDFNNRWKQVLFNSFLVVYQTAFLPCYFSPSSLHYDINWVIQHGIFTGVGCLTMYTVHCFPPKYCDVLHRAALHLGGWQKVEVKNVHVPYSMWTEYAIWNQGALVKHSKELFKAEGISNAAEPGHSGHSRFYTLFKNPSMAAKLMWLLQLLLVSMEMLILVQSHTWNDLLSIQLLIMINCKVLYGMTKVYFVTEKIYHEEKLLISKFSN